MPFTFAHPAIVLPLRHSRFFHFPALVAGSMAPDFEYFFRMQAFRTYSHTLLGMLVFDLPLVIALCLLFRHVVEAPLFSCLPRVVQKRFQKRRAYQSKHPLWVSWLIFVYSALLGIASHLLWDSFTHQGAWAVTSFPILQSLIGFGEVTFPVYKWLQHGSTLIGATALALAVWRGKEVSTVFPEGSEVSLSVKGWYWLSIVLAGVAAASVHLLQIAEPLTRKQLLSCVVPFLSGSLLALVVVSWVFNRLVWKK
ncbi:DUF4184 family protein [Brevibacillus nitrificans]|uniref:DUF4184 family protein n=1 Tax=Brevibacillus nitrificans TaxID=651560 RepID=UPI00285A93D4|nr:DUF4184 family protein [Brevibacillus nitrificans]MDR7318737.1 hypothetical protein [Brevibacillus nitrificans]